MFTGKEDLCETDAVGEKRRKALSERLSLFFW